MPGITSGTLASRLIRLQSFKETVWGTPGLATARWMGVQPYPTFKPYQKSTLFDEDRGSLQNNFLSAVLVEGGDFSVNMHATYEEIIFMLNGGLQAVAPTGGPAYSWAYTAPTNAAWAAQSYTFEYGYDIGTIGCSGAMINKWSLKGGPKKQWEASMSGFFKTYYNNAAIAIASSTNANPIEITTNGNHGLNTGMQVVISGHTINTAANGTWSIVYVSPTKFTITGAVGVGVGGADGTVTKIQTPAIPDRTVEVILFPGTTLKMEAAGGTLGATAFANQLMSFSLDVANGLTPIYGSDTKTPQAWTYDKVTPTLSLKLLWTAQAKAFLNSTLKAGQRAVVQLANVSGSKSATLNFAGVLADDPSFFPNEQAAVSVDFKLEGQYEPVSIANDLGATIVNAVSALP
jgi:hypothetical protein